MPNPASETRIGRISSLPVGVAAGMRLLVPWDTMSFSIGIVRTWRHRYPCGCGRGSRKFAQGGRKNALNRMFDWNDLRYFIAVAREGSTIAAAGSLKVNQSTVQRRLAALEEKLGRKLVERCLLYTSDAADE